MKKLHSSVALAALAAMFMAAPAVAADMEAPPPPAYSWTGFHIGAGGGGNFAFVKEDADGFINTNGNINNGFFIFGDHHADLGKAGFFGTVEAGYDFQLGSSVVLGILANYDFGKTKMNNKSSAIAENTNNPNNITFNDATLKTEWEVGDSWAVGGRLGFLAMDNALIYVTGGYTQANVKSKLSLTDDETNNPNHSFKISDSSWEDGWFVGGGIEALITDNISIKGEYRYNDYGTVKHSDSDVDFADVEGGSFREAETKGDVTVHSIRAVLSYRFNMF